MELNPIESKYMPSPAKSIPPPQEYHRPRRPSERSRRSYSEAEDGTDLHRTRSRGFSIYSLRSNAQEQEFGSAEVPGDEPEPEIFRHTNDSFDQLSSSSVSELEAVLSRQESRPGDAPENENTYEPIPKYRKVGTASDQAVLYMMFTFFAMAGSLVRIGLERLTTFPGSAYGGVLWANFCGCILMGYFVKSSRLFGPLLDGSAKRMTRSYTGIGEIPLYVALTTGFCGSITSFSSFISQLFEISTRQPSSLYVDSVRFPNPGYGVMTWLSYTIVSCGVCMAGFLLGRHFARAVDQSHKMGITIAHHEILLERAICGIGVAGYVAAIVLTIVEPSWRYWTFCLLFSPWGVFCRFWLSRYLNPLAKKFMFGTFTANFIAVIILAVMFVLKFGTRSTIGGEGTRSTRLLTTVLQCHVVAAVQDGFCCCLSTVSTLINELHSFRKIRYAYRYGLISVALSFVVMILILGSYSWTYTLETSLC